MINSKSFQCEERERETRCVKRKLLLLVHNKSKKSVCCEKMNIKALKKDRFSLLLKLKKKIFYYLTWNYDNNNNIRLILY